MQQIKIYCLKVLFIYLGFYVTFNTVQVISRRVVGRAEETSTYSSSGFCTGQIIMHPPRILNNLLFGNILHGCLFVILVKEIFLNFFLLNSFNLLHSLML